MYGKSGRFHGGDGSYWRGWRDQANGPGRGEAKAKWRRRVNEAMGRMNASDLAAFTALALGYQTGAQTPDEAMARFAELSATFAKVGQEEADAKEATRAEARKES